MIASETGKREGDSVSGINESKTITSPGVYGRMIVDSESDVLQNAAEQALQAADRDRQCARNSNVFVADAMGYLVTAPRSPS